MPRMTYEERVEAAAAALTQGEEANWVLAQHTHEATFNGRGDSRADRAEGLVSMERWCADVRLRSGRRFGLPTGRRYRAIWAKYGRSPANDRPLFHDAYAEVEGTPNRDRMMEYEGERLLEQGTPEQKVAQATALLRDPVVREVAKDVGTPLGGTVYGVNEEAKERRREEGVGLARDRDERTQRDPVLKGLDESRALTDLNAALFDFAKAVAALLPRIRVLPDPGNDPSLVVHFMRAGAARARGAVDQVDDLLRTGRPGGGVDAFLQSVLEAEKGGAPGQ